MENNKAEKSFMEKLEIIWSRRKYLRYERKSNILFLIFFFVIFLVALIITIFVPILGSDLQLLFLAIPFLLFSVKWLSSAFYEFRIYSVMIDENIRIEERLKCEEEIK